MADKRCMDCGKPILEGDAHEQYEDGPVCLDCNARYDFPGDGNDFEDDDCDFIDF